MYARLARCGDRNRVGQLPAVRRTLLPMHAIARDCLLRKAWPCAFIDLPGCLGLANIAIRATRGVTELPSNGVFQTQDALACISVGLLHGLGCQGASNGALPPWRGCLAEGEIYAQGVLWVAHRNSTSIKRTSMGRALEAFFWHLDRYSLADIAKNLAAVRESLLPSDIGRY